jgi:polysaccharide biosynthesis protein PslH
MKIRVYSPFVPYPVLGGSEQVIFDQVRSLGKQGHQVELISWRGPDFRDVEWPLADVNTVFWRSDSFLDAASLRVVRMIAGNDASPEALYYPSRLDRRKQLEHFDLGVYHYGFAYGWLAHRSVRSEKLVCVHLHNLESQLFRERAQAATNPFTRLIHTVNATRLREHELLLSELVDEVWFLSPLDLALSGARPANSKTRLVCPSYDPSLWEAQNRKTVQGDDIGFIGSLDFRPNEVSVHWILEQVCPRLVERNFQGRIRIAGRNPPARLIRAASRFPFVQFLGFVPDVETFWRSLRLTLAPHLEGSGVRTKLLESLARGIPVLANTAAVQIIAPELRTDPLMSVGDSGEFWADRIVRSGDDIARRSFPSALDGKTIYSFLKP